MIFGKGFTDVFCGGLHILSFTSSTSPLEKKLELVLLASTTLKSSLISSVNSLRCSKIFLTSL